MEFMPSSLHKPMHSIMEKNELLQCSGTRLATWFYAMHRALQQKATLKAIIHYPSFASLSKNDCVAAAVNDTEDEVFGRQFIIFSMSFSLSWKLWDTAMPTYLQWIKYITLWMRKMKHCLIHNSFWMARICLDHWLERSYLTARKDLMKFLMKQIQKGMKSY